MLSAFPAKLPFERDSTVVGRLAAVLLILLSALAFGYSNNGTKDLTSITWAQVSSGRLTDPASGTFNYNFDGIGRRSGGTDSLNQFTSAVHTTPKKLQVSVAPGASLFVNGQSKTLVDGKYTHVFPAPGAAGVWEPWHVLEVNSTRQPMALAVPTHSKNEA